MVSEISWKNIIICSVVITIIMVLIEFFLDPTSYINFDFLNKFSKKIVASQYICPQRLFVNSWRTVKNSYVDETLNNQDWKYWKNRYFKQVKTLM